MDTLRWSFPSNIARVSSKTRHISSQEDDPGPHLGCPDGNGTSNPRGGPRDQDCVLREGKGSERHNFLLHFSTVAPQEYPIPNPHSKMLSPGRSVSVRFLSAMGMEQDEVLPVRSRSMQ